jgi:hypothetical protein
MPLKSGSQAMREYKAGALHSGKGGPVVTSEKQAKAIAASVERRQGRGKSLKGQRNARSRR